jgi:hypothetical protein
MTESEHRAMCALGARLAAGDKLTRTEYDEYLDLAEPVGAVPAVLAVAAR